MNDDKDAREFNDLVVPRQGEIRLDRDAATGDIYIFEDGGSSEGDNIILIRRDNIKTFVAALRRATGE